MLLTARLLTNSRNQLKNIKVTRGSTNSLMIKRLLKAGCDLVIWDMVLIERRRRTINLGSPITGAMVKILREVLSVHKGKVGKRTLPKIGEKSQAPTSYSLSAPQSPDNRVL
jgi:hypothetical protein